LDPTLEGASAAADIANLPDDMEIVITDSSNPAAYPISGFTWLLIYENQTDPAKADAVAQLASWMITDGQKFAAPLDYAPLKGVAQKKAMALVKKIKANGALVMK
jgi:phosphate transport system substrate-binding protein